MPKETQLVQLLFSSLQQLNHEAMAACEVTRCHAPEQPKSFTKNGFGRIFYRCLSRWLASLLHQTRRARRGLQQWPPVGLPDWSVRFAGYLETPRNQGLPDGLAPSEAEVRGLACKPDSPDGGAPRYVM